MYKCSLRELLLSQTWQHDDQLSNPDQIRSQCYQLIEKAKLDNQTNEVTLKYIKDHNYSHNCKHSNYDKDSAYIYNIITNNGTRRMFIYKSKNVCRHGKCDICDPNESLTTFIGLDVSVGKINVVEVESLIVRSINGCDMIGTEIIQNSNITLKDVLEYNIEIINDLLIYENIDLILDMIKN